MPQPRKPASTLTATGAYVKNRNRQVVDVPAQGAIGAAPGHWDADLRGVWDELVNIAPRGVLRSADRVALEMASRLIMAMRASPENLTAAKVTSLTALLGKFGMTPAGRLSLSLPPSELPPPDPTELPDHLNPKKLAYYR